MPHTSTASKGIFWGERNDRKQNRTGVLGSRTVTAAELNSQAGSQITKGFYQRGVSYRLGVVSKQTR